MKQGKNIDTLLNVVDRLSKKQQLDFKYRVYTGKRFKGCRDCHIEPDWILIYKYLEDEIVLLLVNTGSHSEVLNK